MNNEDGWQVADALARQFTGGNPTLDLVTGPPVIWAKQYNNIPAATSTTVFPISNPNYQAQFKKLWGK